MRTLFVNPTRRRRAAPKHRKHHAKRRKSTGMVLRRNAGITPFVRNTGITVPNPRRRVKRRRNPAGGIVMNGLLNELSGAGGAAAVMVVDMFGTSKISNPWGRNLTRVGLSLAGSLIPGRFGAAMAGAQMVPVFQEILTLLLVGTPRVNMPRGTEASLDEMSADLEDLLRVA